MKYKKYLSWGLALALNATFMTTATSCSDFFDPETEDSLDGDKYISSLTEMYTGYLGILTKLQAIGDKSIYLTDTRAELLEPTNQSIAELIAIYNYDDDLKGNSYANPAGFYDVIIACNDYLQNIVDFKKDHPEIIEDQEKYEGLISSTIRIKVWAYTTLAEIYGQVLWFDDPILKIEDVNDKSKFTLLTLDQTIDKCIDLLTNGYMGIASDLSFSWKDYLDPETALADSKYRYWDMMTPPYTGLLCKLYLWKGAAMNATGQDATTLYKDVCDMMLSELDFWYKQSSYQYYWKRTAATPGNYSGYWDQTEPYARVVVSAITYDYTKNQTNTLLKHFSNEYPNEYLLRPSDIGRERWEDEDFNPGVNTGTEKRGDVTNRQYQGQWYIGKYRPVGSSKRTNAYQDDVHIYTFRSEDYLFMLAEALNGMGRFDACDMVLNGGITQDITKKLAAMTDSPETCSEADLFQWQGFTINWTANPVWGTTKYPYIGIRGCMTLKARPITTDKKNNDASLADEYLLEFPAEGRTYPALIRFAKRWNDASFITSRVTPKYGEQADKIAGKIESNNPITGLPGYFVPWDLGVSK